jgi:WD40 repeat protein
MKISFKMCALSAAFAFHVFLVSIGNGQPSPQNILSRAPGTILDLKYSADGKYLAQIYAEGRYDVLDTRSGQTLLDEQVALDYPLFKASLDWAAATNWLAIGVGKDAYVWDVETAALLHTFQVGGSEPLIYEESGYYIPEGVVSLQWNRDGDALMTKSVSLRYTIWSADSNSIISHQETGSGAVPVVWLDDEGLISTGFSVLDIQSKVFELRLGQRIPEVTGSCGTFLSITSNSQLDLLAHGTSNGCIVIVDSVTGNQRAAYKIVEDGEGIWDVNWSPDDQFIVAVDNAGAVKVVEIATGAVTQIAQQNGTLFAVDWAANNSAIAYGGATSAQDTLFATMSIAEVERLQATSSYQPEFAITPPRD